MTDPALYEHEVCSLKEGIGEIIERERKRRGWSRLDLAARSGITDRTLRRMEKGEVMALKGLIGVLSVLGLELTVIRRRSDSGGIGV